MYEIIANIFGIMQLTNMLAFFHRNNSKKYSKIPRYQIVIVTVGDERVLPSLKEVVSKLESLKLNYVILSSRSIDFKNVIVIPRERDGNKYRAIKWFVESYVENDVWYVFLDDDSYPIDDSFLNDLAYAEENGYHFGNGILVPRPGKSKWAYALDWIRYFDDLTRFRFNALIKKPIYGVHGELLMVKGNVLKDIWLTMDESITEDFNFAMYAMKKGYKFFQSSCKVSIKSPNSLKDFIRQRGRWSNVLRDSIKHFNFIPIVFFITGAIVSPLFFPLWFIYSVPLCAIASLYYIFVYLYGAVKAKTLPIVTHFLSAIEILGYAYGILKGWKRFEVIDKS